MILPPGLPTAALATVETQVAGVETFWAGADAWATGASVGAEPADAAHGRVLAGLGRVYLDHGNPARALVLGLAAMAMGDIAPPTLLLVASAFLDAGDPEQAEAALSRLSQAGGRVSRPPEPAEMAAHDWLMARVLLRLGRLPEARAALDRALAAQARGGPAP